MVLLTSSTISVVISSSVVSAFTFLLFLSGYVLQQQTVRSLQEALRQPPEPKPTPTLPAAFQTGVSVSDSVQPSEVSIFDVMKEAAGVLAEQDQRVFVEVPHDQSGQLEKLITEHSQQTPGASPVAENLPSTHTEIPTSPPPSDADLSIPLMPTAKATAAYLLPLLTPDSVCAALLFAQQQIAFSKQKAKPVILIYPSTWETHPTREAVTALDLLRDKIDSPVETFGHLILHPVQISSIWSGPGMLEGQLLAEIGRSRWEYQRLLYLRLPGLTVDISSLDWALQNSDLRRGWTPFTSAAIASGSNSPLSPSILLWSSSKGILAPRGDMRRLTTSLSTSHSNRHKDEMEIEAKAASKGAAWVVFDEEELEHRRNEKEWYGSIVERFERGRHEVCKGTDLLVG